MSRHRYNPEKYGRPDRLEGQHMRLEYLDELKALAETAGIDLPGLDAARAKVEGSKRLVAELRQLREAPEDAADRIAASLVAGEMTLDEATAELHRVEAMDAGSLLDRAVRRTTARIPDAAFKEFARELDGDEVLAAAKAAAAENVEAIQGLRRTLGDVRDAEHASVSGPKVAAAWAKYVTELLPRWDAACGLIDRLRAVHLIEPLPLEVKQCARFQRPDIARKHAREARKAGQPIRKLLDPLCDEWGPTGPHSSAEAAGYFKAVAAAQEREESRDHKIAERFSANPGDRRARAHAV